MNKNLIVEIAQFKLVAGVSEQNFLKEAETVQKTFSKNRAGTLIENYSKAKMTNGWIFSTGTH